MTSLRVVFQKAIVTSGWEWELGMQKTVRLPAQQGVV